MLDELKAIHAYGRIIQGKRKDIKTMQKDIADIRLENMITKRLLAKHDEQLDNQALCLKVLELTK